MEPPWEEIKKDRNKGKKEREKEGKERKRETNGEMPYVSSEGTVCVAILLWTHPSSDGINSHAQGPNHHPRHANRNAGAWNRAAPALHLSAESLRPVPHQCGLSSRQVQTRPPAPHKNTLLIAELRHQDIAWSLQCLAVWDVHSLIRVPKEEGNGLLRV